MHTGSKQGKGSPSHPEPKGQGRPIPDPVQAHETHSRANAARPAKRRHADTTIGTTSPEATTPTAATYPTCHSTCTGGTRSHPLRNNLAGTGSRPASTPYAAIYLQASTQKVCRNPPQRPRTIYAGRTHRPPCPHPPNLRPRMGHMHAPLVTTNPPTTSPNQAAAHLHAQP